MLPNRTMIVCMPLLVMILFPVGTAGAASVSVSVLNFNFDTPVVPMDGDPDTTSDGDDFVIATPQHWQAPHESSAIKGSLTRASGSYFHDKLAATPDPSDNDQNFWSNGGEIYQVLSTHLAPDSIYTLRADVGDRSDTAFPPGTEIRLGYGVTPGANLLAASMITDPTPPDGGWATWENVYITGAHPAGLGHLLRIELASGGTQAQFDNVQLMVAAIPEPTSASLAGLALVGLCCFAWRRLRTV